MEEARGTQNAGLGLRDWVPVHSYTTGSVLVVKMDDEAIVRYNLTPVNQWECGQVGWLEEVKGLIALTCMKMRVGFGDWVEESGGGDTRETGMIEWCALAARLGGEVGEPVKMKDDDDFAWVKRLVEGTTHWIQRRGSKKRGLVDEMAEEDLTVEWGIVEGVAGVRVNLFGISERVGYGDSDG